MDHRMKKPATMKKSVSGVFFSVNRELYEIVIMSMMLYRAEN